MKFSGIPTSLFEDNVVIDVATCTGQCDATFICRGIYLQPAVAGSGVRCLLLSKATEALGEDDPEPSWSLLKVDPATTSTPATTTAVSAAAVNTSSAVTGATIAASAASTSEDAVPTVATTVAATPSGEGTNTPGVMTASTALTATPKARQGALNSGQLATTAKVPSAAAAGIGAGVAVAVVVFIAVAMACRRRSRRGRHHLTAMAAAAASGTRRNTGSPGELPREMTSTGAAAALAVSPRVATGAARMEASFSLVQRLPDSRAAADVVSDRYGSATMV